MKVRTKFSVISKTETTQGHTINLSAVYDSDSNSENGKFFKWTPCASISLQTVNDLAAAGFKVGGEYYVDFTEAQSNDNSN